MSDSLRQPWVLVSILAAGLTIEGKIECSGNIRVAGRFQGNVKVTGELTIEPGASIDGEVTADTVLVGGEVQGLIVAASRVEFKESGVLIGALKAGLELGLWHGVRDDAETTWLRFYHPDGTLVPTRDEAARQLAEAATTRAEES